ncbi:MAG: AraC family transcriptional regulator [Pseudomonadota bacterium]
MKKFDRLSALVDRFELSVAPWPEDGANLVIRELAQGGWALRLGESADADATTVVFRARVDWGDGDNPLFIALPGLITREIGSDEELGLIVQLLVAEGRAGRCGAATVLNRLGEVLIVRIVREAIERGASEPGVLGGLADPRLSRAIVSMHEAPGQNWRNEDLAEIAGLSRSRFAELFVEAVGETPLAYLRRWRLVLARKDLERGDRVQSVARRYGYASGEAFNRAFQRFFGHPPTGLRASALDAA